MKSLYVKAPVGPCQRGLSFNRVERLVFSAMCVYVILFTVEDYIQQLFSQVASKRAKIHLANI